MRQQKENRKSGSRAGRRAFVLAASLCVLSVLVAGIRQEGKEKQDGSDGSPAAEAGIASVEKTQIDPAGSFVEGNPVEAGIAAAPAGKEKPAKTELTDRPAGGKEPAKTELTDRPVGENELDKLMIPGTSVSAKEQKQRLLLVNKSHPVPEDYEVQMAEVEDGYLAAAQIRGALKRMLADGRKQVTDGGFMIVSAYRSRELQEELLQEEIRKNLWQGMPRRTAEWDALRTVAPAGCSEHETGLAVDIVSENDPELKESQEETAENRWLQENCWKYGFILRYPRDKEEVTGFAYEPWHFRYVGTYDAKRIAHEGVTLEEYLEAMQ